MEYILSEVQGSEQKWSAVNMGMAQHDYCGRSKKSQKESREKGSGRVTGEEGNVVSLRTMVHTVTLSDMGSH